MRRSATRPLDRDVQVALIRAASLLRDNLFWSSTMTHERETEAVLEVIDTILATRSPGALENKRLLGRQCSRASISVGALAVCAHCDGSVTKPQCAACKGCRSEKLYALGSWRGIWHRSCDDEEADE